MDDVMLSEQKQNILGFYGHCAECEDCMGKYKQFRDGMIIDKKAIFDDHPNRAYLSFDLFLKNEKILTEVLFRN